MAAGARREKAVSPAASSGGKTQTPGASGGPASPEPVPSPAITRGTVPAGTIAALQGALKAENAAIYGYGVAGTRLSGTQLAAARRDWDRHRAAQATLTAMLEKLGARPAPAAAAYTLPFPVRTARQAVSLAAFLEEGVTTAYLGLVALDDTSLRAFGAHAVQACALRAASWRGSTVAFPGFPSGTPRRTRSSPSRSSPSR